MHADQRAIDGAQVVALVADQVPRLRGEPVVPLPGSGTVNAVFRIGQVATARFPLRPSPAGELRAELEREASAAAEFVLASPFPAPEPILVGEPGHGYPLPWTLQTWLDGDPPSPTSAADSTMLAADLARLIDRLRDWSTAGRVFDATTAAADSPTTTTGWRSASSVVRACSTRLYCAGCGPASVGFRAWNRM